MPGSDGNPDSGETKPIPGRKLRVARRESVLSIPGGIAGTASPRRQPIQTTGFREEGRHVKRVCGAGDAGASLENDSAA